MILDDLRVMFWVISELRSSFFGGGVFFFFFSFVCVFPVTYGDFVVINAWFLRDIFGRFMVMAE